jgi:hypothetical protein
MTWFFIVLAISQGQPPMEYRYPMPDRDTCIAQRLNADSSRGLIGGAFIAFCVPATETPKG